MLCTDVSSLALIFGCSCAFAAPLTPAWAQNPSDDGDSDDLLMLEPIVVTATRRSENAADIPLSVSSLSEDVLRDLRAGARDIRFLAGRTASLNVESSLGRIFPRFYIRGLGNTDFDFNASQPVAQIYDGVVLENPILKGFPAFDLERVEVLRGPQGTLFGRNTPAGTVKYESRAPSDTAEVFARTSYGRFDTLDLEAVISAPLPNYRDVKIRIAVLHHRQSDFIDNTFTGENIGGFDDFAGKAHVVYDADPDTHLSLRLRGRYLNGNSIPFRANAFTQGGGLAEGFARDRIAQDGLNAQELDQFGVSGLFRRTFGSLTLTSNTAYETARTASRGDVDGGFGAVFAPPSGPGTIPFPSETEDAVDDLDQYTTEVTLAADITERFDVQGGFFFFRENLEITSRSFDTLAGGDQNGVALQKQNSDTWAIFGSATFTPIDALTLRAGLRYTSDDRELTAQRTQTPFGGENLAPTTARVDDAVISFEAAASYRVHPTVTLFTRVARGYRSPSIQGRVAFQDEVSTADSETVISIDAGAKTSFLHGRVQAETAGFIYWIDDQQFTAVGGVDNMTRLLNSDRGRGFGFEIDLRANIVQGLTTSLSASLNDTEIQDDELAVAACLSCTVTDARTVDGFALVDGNPFPQAPRWIVAARTRYELPLAGRGWFVEADLTHRSEASFFLYESLEFRDDVTELGARIGVSGPEERWTISAFGRNILNDVSFVGAIDFNNLTGIVNAPPLWGFEIAAKL